MPRKKQTSEAAVREIRRRTRRKFAPEEKVRIVLEGLRGEQSRAERGGAVSPRRDLPRTSTTDGARTSSKPGRNNSPATQSVKQRAMK